MVELANAQQVGPAAGAARSGPVPAELELAPFRGVRYTTTAPAQLARLTCPPLDQLDREQRVALHRADPHNALRLLASHAAGSGRGAQRAGRTLRRWLAGGVLAADPAPALYVYEIRTQHSVVRGLVGALRLVPPEAGVVLPHEDTMPGAVIHRLGLVEAVQANLDPIYLLADGEPGPAAAAAANAASAAPLASCPAPDGSTHRLWSIADPDVLAAVAEDLRPRQALIVDGHHRYSAYLRHQVQRRARGDGPGPWDRALALLVDAAAFGATVQPFHRVVAGLPLAEAVHRAAAAFRLTDLPGAAAGEGLAAAGEALAAAGDRGPAFVLTDGTRWVLLSDPSDRVLDRVVPGGRSDRWRRLDVVALHSMLLRELWDMPASGSHVGYIAGVDRAVAAARERCGIAALLNPVPMRTVLGLARAGERMPQKSTVFAPKPRTGLVLRTYDEDRPCGGFE
jgi:uncharacterized protein (DUF1015 family)